MGRCGYDSGYDDGRSYRDRFEETIRDDRRSNQREDYYDDGIYDEDDYDDDIYDEDDYEENRRYSDYEEDRYEEDRYEENQRYRDYEDIRLESKGERKREIFISEDNRERANQEESSKAIYDRIFKKCDDSSLIDEIGEFLGKTIALTLKPSQLNVLGQVFRPIFVAKLEEVGVDYVLLKNVNIKMSNAPEYIFPTPLIIPINQVVWFTPFDAEKSFPLY